MRLVILTLAGALCAHAQWLNRPTPGTPRLHNGKANLTAPAPRKGGKPDLSGVWQAEGHVESGGLGESLISKYLINFFADFKPGEEPFTPAAAAKFRQNPSGAGKLDPPCPPPRLPFSDLRTKSAGQPAADLPRLLGGEMGRRNVRGELIGVQRSFAAR